MKMIVNVNENDAIKLKKLDTEIRILTYVLAFQAGMLCVLLLVVLPPTHDLVWPVPLALGTALSMVHGAWLKRGVKAKQDALVDALVAVEK